MKNKADFINILFEYTCLAVSHIKLVYQIKGQCGLFAKLFFIFSLSTKSMKYIDSEQCVKQNRFICGPQ